MREQHGAAQDQHEAERYEIRLKGQLDARWANRFEGLTLTHTSDGITILTGPVVDQAALHGVLRQVRDLGLPLLSITQVTPIQPDQRAGNPDTDHPHLNKETKL